MELNEDNSSNINDLDHNSNPSHLEDLKSSNLKINFNQKIFFNFIDF